MQLRVALHVVRAALPEPGAPRAAADGALRSLFDVLKGRKAIFLNPMRGIPVSKVAKTVPLPVDTAAIRAAMDCPNPAAALAVALVAFHALTQQQLRSIQVTDIADGRLSVEGRAIPLAGPVQVRLAAWLDHRARTWPNTTNPHLLINRRSAPRLKSVGARFPWVDLGLTCQELREDRILQEIHATGGDVRRV